MDHTSRRRTPSRRRTALTAAGLVTTTVASLAVFSGVAAGAVPVAPNNIVAFPNRDFVSVEGYGDRVGQVATLTLDRPGVGTVGSAKATVAAGGVAFEINHPGGACWGAGTGLNITPDMLPGDVIKVTFPDGFSDDTRVQDAFVTGDAVQGAGAADNTVVVQGHINPAIDKANVEQRIVEPALVDTIVGKRDVRAIPGPLTPAPKGGYSSGLEFPTADTFKATYVFDDPDGPDALTGADIAVIAANATLGERLLSWESVDLAGNRQGITIAEFGELGGPGFGGCPNGPLQAGPPGPTNVLAKNVGGDIAVTWTPAVALPGTPPITGYRVHAVHKLVPGATEQQEIGKRITGVAAKGTTLTGLSGPQSDYSVEVVSTSATGSTFPVVTAIPEDDLTAPTVAANPAGGSFATPQLVSLTANEAGAQIFYTLDGSAPIDPVNLSAGPTALAYEGPFMVGASGTLRFGAFDVAGNPSGIGQSTFTITNLPTPAAPVFEAPAVSETSVVLKWHPGDAEAVTGYSVQTFDANGAAVGAPVTTAGNVTTATVTGLTAETQYFFTVKAQNTNGFGPESAQAGVITLGPIIAKAGADFTVTRGTAPKTVVLSGEGSTVSGATYLWQQINPGPNAVPMANTTSKNASFTLPLFAYPNTNAPLTFRLTVTTDAGSKTDDVLVTPVPDQVAFASAKFKVGDVRVVGTGSLVGTTVRVHAGSLAGPLIGSPVLVTAAAPPGIGDFSVRVRTGQANLPASNPGTVWVESTGGGTAGPFTMTNG